MKEIKKSEVLHPFRKPMQPFPGLEKWSQQVTLPRNAVDLFFYDAGEDTNVPVLLIHGLGDEADTWHHVLPLISTQLRVIAPDLPGFGRSEKPDRKYTVPFFADAMIELMDSLSVSRAVIVGHSTGAIIAHQIALTHPERVTQLILIGGALVSQAQRINLGLLTFLIPGLGEWSYNRLRKSPEAAYQTLLPYYSRIDDLPAADRDFLFQRVNERVWSDGQRRAFFSTFRNLAAWLPAQQMGLPARLKSWRIPTRIIWGEHDRVNSIQNAHLLKRMIPAADLLIIPETGHNVQQEKPEIVAEVILNSVAEV